MKGEILKERLIRRYKTLADVARVLAISPQALNQTLSAADIKTGFIEKLANAYGVSPATFFVDSFPAMNYIEGNNNQLNESGAHGNRNGGSDVTLQERIKSLQDLMNERDKRILGLEQQLDTANERIAEKNEHIADLKERIKELKEK